MKDGLSQAKSLLWVICAVMFVFSEAAYSAPVAVTPRPLKVRLWVKPEATDGAADAKPRALDATILGRERECLVVTADDEASLHKRIKIDSIAGADFIVEYDAHAVRRATLKRDWANVISPLTKAWSPTFPYLDIPQNNAADAALYLGTLMFNAAKRTELAAQNAEEKTLATRQYAAAAEIFAHCTRAAWSSVGAFGALKRSRCLLAIDAAQASAVSRSIAKMSEPLPGDDTYGYYWLLRAELAMLADNVTNAMDAAVNSLCFENKDIETFPDALLISAKCYERLGNHFRARDVYFEVAKLFPGTDWADTALAALNAVMLAGKTSAEEAKTAESSFFGLEEDMDALAKALIEERKKSLPQLPDEPEE